MSRIRLRKRSIRLGTDLVEKAATSVGIFTPQKNPPHSPGSPRYALCAWATIANLGVPNSVRTF
jgi:hypothetical protein